MFYLELTTGIRRGELVALLWTDLDLENYALTISKSAGQINGEVKVTQPKTANSVRTIFLPEETVDLLVQEHAKHPGTPIMFPSPVTGNLYGPDCIGRLHKTLLKNAGITENIPFHGLRHTHATLAIQQGVDAKTVSSILGHYSAGFTLDTYTHVTGEMQKDAAQRIGSFIAQAVQKPEKECGSAEPRGRYSRKNFWYGSCLGQNKNTQNPGKQIRIKSKQNLLISSEIRRFLVGVAGLEPAASWSRRFGSKFSGRFRTHLVLFVPRAVAFQTSPFQCLRPLPPWSGSAFGSGRNCTGLHRSVKSGVLVDAFGQME